MRRFAAALVLLSAAGLPAAAEDARAPVKLPPDMRAPFLEHMRHHMDSLDDLIAAMAAGDFARAAQVARTELVVGGGQGFGRFLPIEFREMGLAMHRAAADFATVAAAIPKEPQAADWKKAVIALEDISAQCRGCHAAFRLE